MKNPSTIKFANTQISQYVSCNLQIAYPKNLYMYIELYWAPGPYGNQRICRANYRSPRVQVGRWTPGEKPLSPFNRHV